MMEKRSNLPKDRVDVEKINVNSYYCGKCGRKYNTQKTLDEKDPKVCPTCDSENCEECKLK